MTEPNFTSTPAAERPNDAVDIAPLTEPLLDPSNEPQGVTRSGKHLSRWQLILRRFWRSIGARVGVVGLALILVLALAGPFVANWDYFYSDDMAFLSPPDSVHWLGTNQGGFDVFAMTVEGLRKSLLIGFAVAAIIEVLAALIGAAAAYFGKAVEKTLLWFTDLLLVIPSFLLIAIISQHTGGRKSSTWLLILLLAAFSWMLSARVVRAMTLSVVSLDYVTAAKFMSVPSFVVIVKHVIPNIASYLIIDFTLGVVNAVMSETALSFFGFGVQKPETSLGTLLADGMNSATTSPWIFLAPATVLVITLLSVNFIGDALRDAIDPSSKSGGQA
ncbi:ABC transporter permease [Acidipropionibacterium virtanenii]|uniref:Oligopeptide transport system permease protein OppC n=1 Tax=Acidipropionibacterium virtanenii TaxID=2057246 RepID=A0A344US96_9ACTN|nr:ABC transporter permease [Acidipropionibacterium virtanenii]AXE38144.1 Putative peptide transport permease protein [Acidipropionibacterium virtanenii]